MTRRWQLAVCAVIAVALGLRASGVAAGAPFRMGVDEPAVIGVAIRMMQSGDFNPHFFDYGGLTLYLQMAVACVRFLAGAMSGQWASLNDIWVGDFLVWGRLVSVALGTFTVFLVYCVGLRWGRPAAFLAVCAMAVQPQHVRESHFALTDTPLTFFIALTMLLSLRASEQASARPFVYAGMAAGLAAATKYNGVLAVVMPLLASVAFQNARTSAVAIAAAVGGAIAGFLIGAPYSVIDLPAFLNGFAGLMQHYNAPRPVGEAAVTYLKYMRGWFSFPAYLPATFGWIAMTVCLLGLIVGVSGVRKRATRAAALVLTVFPLLYFWFISKQGALQFARYALPLTPMLSILFALGVVTLRTRLLQTRTFGRRLAAASCVALLLPPLGSSIERNVMDARIGTPEQLAIWVIAHIPPDQPLVIEADLIRLPPRYKVAHVPRLIERPFEQYQKEGVGYLIASSSISDRFFSEPARRKEEIERYMQMMASGEVVQTFPPSPDHPGPTITVLKVRR